MPPETDPEDRPTPLNRGRTTQERLAEGRGPGFFGTLLRTLAGLGVLLVVLAVIFVVASVVQGDKPVERAPWAAKSAPDVTPAPLSEQ